MLRKAVWSAIASVAVTLVSLSLLTMGVMAQSDTTTPADEALFTVQPNVAAARVTQTVPVTLTLTIPGPTGPITVEVPIFLNLDIQIGISSELTTTVEITPSVATDGVTDVAATPTATVESTPTALPTLIPTAAAPTATPIPTDEASTEPEATEPEVTEEPEVTATPEAVLEPTTTPAAVVEAPLCPDPRSVIVAPGVGQVVSGDVNMLGTATHEDFQYYKVEYAPGVDVDPNESFVYIADARTQVTGGVLATFDSTIVDNGDYTLKLTVVDRVGNFPPPCTVSVVITN